jgi:hypothetical protein
MFVLPRRSAPKVCNGKVQRKNRWAPTPNCYNTAQPSPVIDQLRPGRGYRHLVRKADLWRFIGLVPNWQDLALGINVLILGPGRADCFGWHRPGLVALCAWEREIVLSEYDDEFYRQHQHLLECLTVPCVRRGMYWDLQFTENSARAFQLVHVLLHELGHHHDRMTTRSKTRASRGESYAQAFARRYEATVLARYRNEFPL